MTGLSPEREQQIPAEVRLAQYGERTSTWSTATYNDGTEKALHQIAVELKAELDRVRRELAEARACDCFPNPNDHADRCPIFQAAYPNAGEENW